MINPGNLVPYSAEGFLDLVAVYNVALWPVHIPVLLVLLATAFWAGNPRHRLHQTVWLISGTCWIAIGLLFYRGWLSELTWLATWLSYGFCLQGIFLVIRGLRPVPPQDSLVLYRPARAGWALVALSLVYMGLSSQGPFGYESLQVPGLHAAPTALFTLGLLALARRKGDALLAILPVGWCFFAALESWELGLWQDLLLPLGAIMWIIDRVSARPTMGRG